MMPCKRVGACWLMCLGAMRVIALADLGDVRATLNAKPPTGQNLCAVGLAFKGRTPPAPSSLYLSRCLDTHIYEISTTGLQLGDFDTGIDEFPAALAYDAKRNGVWIGTQGGFDADFQECGQLGAPIYFLDFDDNSVTLAFIVPLTITAPTPFSFFTFCFLDGLAYRENSPDSDLDDEIWLSDTDASPNIGVFRPDGSPVGMLDARTVDPNLIGQSGLAIGGDLAYLSDDGSGHVFRAVAESDPLIAFDRQAFASSPRWEADMECDGVTFAPSHVIWVRSNPQCDPRFDPSCAANDVMTAYEIEPGGCGAGQVTGACCAPSNPPCRIVPQAACQGSWHEGVPCADVQPPCFAVHRIILLDRTGSMEKVVLPDGMTLCEKTRMQGRTEVMTFFANQPAGSSVSIWTFRANGPTPLTSGFVGEAEAIAALDSLVGVACSNLTPLAESICAAVDSIVAAFPAEPYQTLEVSIISDGLENNSDGPCAGPAATTGNSCVLVELDDELFNVGSWQRKACDYMIGHAVANTTLWGDICDGCRTLGKNEDAETGLLLGPGVSDAVFFKALADATGGHFVHADTTPPLATGTPPFGVTGACCLPNAQCEDNVTEAECSIQFGIHRGEGSTCDNLPTACPEAIPTVSAWGMIVLVLGITVAGSLLLFRYRKVEAVT